MQSSKKITGVTPKFPKRFLWGVTTSAHQHEGATHNQWTEWEQQTMHTLAAQSEYSFGELEVWDEIIKEAKDPSSYSSGLAVDHYTHYETDFLLAKKMGLNAWRCSIEWSRIEPEEGVWSAAAIEHYKSYVSSLKKAGLEPFVTLFHFTLPVWFAKKGGFEKRRNIEYFVRFAEKMITELGPTVKYIITLNEPTTYAAESYLEGNWPPQVHAKTAWLRVLRNLATAHNRTAKALHSKHRRIKVSVAHTSSYVYPGDDAWVSQISARFGQYIHDDYFLKKVIKHCDFLGVNYYTSDRYYGYRIHNPETSVSDTGLDVAPENLEFALNRLYDRYKLPLIVTGNGLADVHDEKRIMWLSKTIMAMQRSFDHGTKIEGYFYSSLLDAFEWEKGFWPKYGLVAVDRKTMARMPRKSARWFQRFLKQVGSRE